LETARADKGEIAHRGSADGVEKVTIRVPRNASVRWAIQFEPSAG